MHIVFKMDIFFMVSSGKTMFGGESCYVRYVYMVVLAPNR